MKKYKIGDYVRVIRTKSIRTPTMFLGRTGYIVEHGNAFDWIVEFSIYASCPFNECELGLIENA